MGKNNVCFYFQFYVRKLWMMMMVIGIAECIERVEKWKTEMFESNMPEAVRIEEKQAILFHFVALDHTEKGTVNLFSSQATIYFDAFAAVSSLPLTLFVVVVVASQHIQL